MSAIPQLLVYVVILPCKILISENKQLMISHKVVSYVLRRGVAVNNQIKKGLFLKKVCQ